MRYFYFYPQAIYILKIEKNRAYAMHITPPSLMTTLFTRLIASDEFEKIRHLRILELEERNKLFDATCPNLPTYGNLHSPIRWLHLPESILPSDFEALAKKNGLHLYSADRLFVGSGQIPSAVRLSLISAHPLEQYEKGLHILRNLYEKVQNKKKGGLSYL